MIQFFISIIFIGITVVVFALAMVFLDKRKGNDYVKQLDNKKEELVKIIADADLMIGELNRFSDYVVSQIDSKSEEIGEYLKGIDDKICKARDLSKQVNAIKDLPENKIPVEVAEVASAVQTPEEPNYENGLILDSILMNTAKQVYSNNFKLQEPEKVLPANLRHKEVIQLADMGLSETEIAKRLSMGRGEIQLIIGMNR